MVVKNLEFFDKDGYNLNLNWNEQKKIWEGNIFFPRVSVGLYENTTIYVVERDENIIGDFEDVYTYPTGDGNISFQWDLANKFVDEFFMFNFDENYEIKDTSSLIYKPYDGPLCETLIINNRLYIGNCRFCNRCGCLRLCCRTGGNRIFGRRTVTSCETNRQNNQHR